MSSSGCLALLLDGPLQSWGYASRFTRRTTALQPTKSAVIGLLAAALGIDKHAPDENARLQPLAALQCTTLALPRQREGRELPILRLSDYHTIGGGFAKAREAMKKPRAASGAALETVLSERHYLLDARFGVLLEGAREMLEQAAASLRNPKWGVWLGRKCCVPASPLVAALAESRPEAMRALLVRAGYEPTLELGRFEHVVEGAEAEGPGSEWRQDVPVAFGATLGQRHAPRRLRAVSRVAAAPPQ